MYQRASVLGWEGEQTTSAESFRMPGSARPILRDELSLLGHGQPGIESPLESSGLPLLVYRQLVSLANFYVTLQPLHEQVWTFARRRKVAQRWNFAEKFSEHSWRESLHCREPHYFCPDSQVLRRAALMLFLPPKHRLVQGHRKPQLIRQASGSAEVGRGQRLPCVWLLWVCNPAL